MTPSSPLSEGQRHLVANVADGDGVFARTGGREQALDRFFQWLTQFERLMMDRKNEIRAGVVGHRQCLFRIAVGADPRIVGSNRHDGEVDRLRGTNRVERVCVRRVPAENDPVAARVDEVSVVTAMRVHARAPVPHFKSPDSRRTNLTSFVPAKFPHRTIVAGAQKIAGAGGGHHTRSRIFELPQRGEIEVTDVGVGEQDEIERGEILDAHGRVNQTLQAEDERTDADADSGAEHGVSEDSETFDAKKNSEASAAAFWI